MPGARNPTADKNFPLAAKQLFLAIISAKLLSPKAAGAIKKKKTHPKIILVHTVKIVWAGSSGRATYL